MGQIMLHIPTSVPDTLPLKLAPRPGTLRGARLALLDNGKEFSDQVLDAVGEVMKREYDVGEVTIWRKGFPAKAAPFILEMAPSCDVVVNGVGHCGSSSPWSVHDAVALEKEGVPTVTLISRSFCPLGQVVAQRLAYPGLPIVLLPHPIGDADEDKISQKGLDAVEECVRLLTTPGETIDAEFQAKKFPLPEHAVARL